MTNVVGIKTNAPIEVQVDDGLLSDLENLVQQVKAGHVVQVACVAMTKNGGVTSLLPSGKKPYAMLGAIYFLAKQYENKSFEVDGK